MYQPSTNSKVLKQYLHDCVAQVVLLLFPICLVRMRPASCYIFQGKHAKRLYSKDGAEKLSFAQATSKFHVFGGNFSRSFLAVVIG